MNKPTQLLGEIAKLSRYPRGNLKSTLNVPNELLDRIDACLRHEFSKPLNPTKLPSHPWRNGK